VKRCPTCNRVEADDTLAFCRADGTALASDSSSLTSGSSLAQELFFAHTESGNLTEYIDNYFDTTIGSKTAVECYLRIAIALSLRPMEVLFISDIVEELNAASSAGLQSLLSIRPGNRPPDFPSRHQTIQNFSEISFPGILVLIRSLWTTTLGRNNFSRSSKTSSKRGLRHDYLSKFDNDRESGPLLFGHYRLSLSVRSV
jgi:hypothetical protein